MPGVPLSLLDLAIVGPNESIRESLDGCVQIAQLAEDLGYQRVWYAEHHNMATIASSATSVLIAHVAANTKSIRLFNSYNTIFANFVNRIGNNFADRSVTSRNCCNACDVALVINLF